MPTGLWVPGNRDLTNSVSGCRSVTLEKWLSAREAADWTLVVALQNKSMAAQGIDNGEMYSHTFCLLYTSDAADD